MIESLVGLHAGLGELGAIAFIWAFVELLDPTPKRLKRAKIAGWIGFIAFLAAWVAGGFYYVEFYGENVKPLIKEGPSKWAHSLIMETKEHLFLFLPFLSALALAAMYKVQERKPLLLLTGLIVLLAFSMAGMGFLISSGYRDALELVIS